MSGLGEAAWLTQVGRPVSLPRRSLGCNPDTYWSTKISNPVGDPRSNVRAEATSWPSGASQKAGVDRLVPSTAGERVLPGLSWAQVAELVK